MTIPPTSPADLEAMVTRLRSAAAEFARLPVSAKVSLLRSMRDGYLAIAEASVREACVAKGIAFDSPTSGEEWLLGPLIVLRILRLTEDALLQVARHGRPLIAPGQVRELPDGRLAVRVYPSDVFDRVLLMQHEGEVYLQPGVTRGNVHEHQARFYRQPHDGRVCLVLGAGNVNAIPPTDVVSKMFIDGAVCILKMNPVNAYLGPLLERAFAPLIARGFFAVAYGGVEEGSFLAQHPAVDEVHMTGSDKTHDLMVWGHAGPERIARQARDERLLKKDFSSELGNITPVIVVPGRWDAASLDFQARNVAGMVCNNASFNCTAAKLLVTSKAWPQRDEFLRRVGDAIAQGGVRKAYYPGAEQRWHQFVDGRSNVRRIGNPGPGELAYALLTDVDRGVKDDLVWTQEPWCTVLSETAFDSADVDVFCRDVTAFLNEQVWGTLSAMVLVSSSTLSEQRGRGAVELMFRELKYGTVVQNTWAGAAFGLGTMPWGGHPSSTLKNIQSGKGWVHNTYLFDDVEKAVLRAPPKMLAAAPWFPGHRTQHVMARRLTEFEYEPSWSKVPGIALAGMGA